MIGTMATWRCFQAWCFVMAFASLGFIQGEVRAAEPGYEAEIVGANPFAFSGPGVGYYPTSMLRAGQTVTVIGQRIGEWVAIVPPTGSFSWIPVKSVDEQPDGTGVVIADEARIRVGSNLNDAHHVFQITAKKGTRVEILDQVYLKDQGQVNLWYKIRPPADEARYVAAENVKLPVASTAEGTPTGAPIANAGNAAPPRIPAPAPGMNRFQVVSNRIIPPAQPIGQGTNGTQREAAIAADGGEATENPPTILADDSTLPFDARVASLESQLQVLRTRDPSTWDLGAAKGVLEGMHADAKTPEEKTRAMGLLAEVRRLAELEDRYGRARKQHELSRQTDEELAILQQRVASQVRQLVPQFTARGLLENGALSVDGQPTFVLKNADGFTTHYVVAPPGMNVKSYVGTNVGLLGELSNRDGLPAPVLQLEQLTPLDAR